MFSVRKNSLAESKEASHRYMFSEDVIVFLMLIGEKRKMWESETCPTPTCTLVCIFLFSSSYVYSFVYCRVSWRVLLRVFHMDMLRS